MIPITSMIKGTQSKPNFEYWFTLLEMKKQNKEMLKFLRFIDQLKIFLSSDNSSVSTTKQR